MKERIKMEFKAVDHLPFDVKAAIKKRVSVRSFERKSLTAEDKNKLMDFSEALTNPFNVNVRVQYISKNSGAENVKLGTYGTIKGAKDFLAITVKDETFAMEAVGYQFENVVLYATDMGLGTVWLAATFSRKILKMPWKYVRMNYSLAFVRLVIHLKNVHLLKNSQGQVLALKKEKHGISYFIYKILQKRCLKQMLDNTRRHLKC